MNLPKTKQNKWFKQSSKWQSQSAISVYQQKTMKDEVKIIVPFELASENMIYFE